MTALAGATQGSAAINAGRFEQATAVLERSLEVARRAGSSCGQGIFLDNLGFAAYLSGDLGDKGRGLIEESADLRRRTGGAFAALPAHSSTWGRSPSPMGTSDGHTSCTCRA